MTDDRMDDIRQRLAQAAEVTDDWVAGHVPGQPVAEPAPAASPVVEAAPAAPAPLPADTDGELRNELADADRFVRDVVGVAWYCPARASNRAGDVESGWLVWDGKRLCPSEDGAILRLAKKTALALSDEYLTQAQDAAKAVKIAEAGEPPDQGAIKAARSRLSRLLSNADRVQSEGRMRTMISLARIDARVLVDHRQLDADPNILNTPSGVLHLPTSELRPHDPSFRCTRITASPFDKNTDQSKLMQLLHRGCMKQAEDGTWVTDHERIAYLQKVIGAGLYGHQNLQQFYLCIGNGGDGKGTLFEALLEALGGGHDGYAMKADMQSFVRQKVSGHRIRDDLANMAGARLVIASEINKGESLDGALVKTLSGEDTQRVRHLFGKEFEFRPICTLFMQANHEPYVDSQDDAIWRRLVKIPFGPSLRPEERDPAVRQALHDPATGGAALLAWAAEGARLTYQAKRIELCDSVAAATAGYRDEMNPLAGFLVDELRFASTAKARDTWVEQRAIRPAFLAWQIDVGMDDNRGPGISGKRVGATLRECGAWSGVRKVGGKTVKVWFGVTLRSDHDQFAETCLHSFVPDETMHQAQLASSGAIQVTSVTRLPHSHINTPAQVSENATRTRSLLGAFSTSPAHGDSTSIENEVTRLPGYQKELKQTHIPDLDDLEGPF